MEPLPLEVWITFSDPVLLVATAGLGLMLGGTGTWLVLADHRKAAFAFLEQAFEGNTAESNPSVLRRGLMWGMAYLGSGAVYVAIGSLLFATGWVEPGWQAVAAWFVLNLGAGTMATGGVATGSLIVLSNRYRVLRSVRSTYISSLPEDRLKNVDVARQAKLERAEILLERNLGANIVIKQVLFANAGIFKNVSWQLSPGINVMLGRNGYGKSYLLRLMVGLLSYDTDRLPNLVGRMDSGFNMSLKLLRNGKPVEIEHDGRAFDESIGKVPLLAIPDSRFFNRARNSVAAAGGDYADLARHGSHHFLYDQPFESTIQTVLAQMCIDVIGTEGKYKEYPESPQLKMLEDVIYALSGERFRFKRISSIGSARFTITVETEASPGRSITIQKASQGTLSVIAMFGLIYQYLRQVHPEVPERKLHKQKAIVLIDEVDAHLHPVWQRKIVHLLRQRFPNVQFVLTAHSPLVVAGCSYGEVSVLKLVGKSLQVIEFQHDFVGTSVDDIYRDIFDVGERDEAFLEYYAQLPIVRDLEKELAALRSESNADQERIGRAEEELSLIKRTHKMEEEDLQLEALQRENDQLKRQLAAARQSKQQGSS